MTADERIAELEQRMTALEIYVNDLYLASCAETQARLAAMIRRRGAAS